MFSILLAEINCCYQQHIQGQEYRIWQDAITVDEICNLMALVMLMGCDDWDSMENYWSTLATLCSTLLRSHET
jgi:hypothetical protein